MNNNKKDRVLRDKIHHKAGIIEANKLSLHKSHIQEIQMSIHKHLT